MQNSDLMIHNFMLKSFEYILLHIILPTYFMIFHYLFADSRNSIAFNCFLLTSFFHKVQQQLNANHNCSNTPHSPL